MLLTLMLMNVNVLGGEEHQVVRMMGQVWEMGSCEESLAMSAASKEGLREAPGGFWTLEFGWRHLS